MTEREPGQWWVQTDKQNRTDAKYFRVFFCGKDSKNRLIFEDADGNTEADHGCDWSGWHHEPACTGWDWVPEEFPQWYSYKNGPFESNNDPYLVRVDSDGEQAFVHRSGKIDRVTYPYKPQELIENVRSGAWKRLSQQEADEALHPKKLLSPDVVNDLAVTLRKETKADVAESPDDWVTQDRVNARNGVDEFRWIWRSGNPSEWHSYHLIDVKHHIHGYIDKEGDRFELRCRRKDLPVVEEKRPLPCSYCSKPEFKGWHDGKCPYCGNVKAEKSQDPGEGYRFVNSDEVVLQTDERAYLYEDTEVTGLIWGEVDKAVWFEAGKTAEDLRRKLRARNVVFRRKAGNAATVTVYEVLYGDEVGESGDKLTLTFCTSEKDVNRIRDVWKYVSVVSTKTVEVML